MPIPGVMAGALARRTKNAKIAVLGRALPLLNNPLVVAEEFAMLDNITGGRLVAGFVRGIGAEYHSCGVEPGRVARPLPRGARSDPAGLDAAGTVRRFEGKYYHFEYVNLWPRPYQQPHPPIWIPSQGSRETIEWASHPSRKYTYLQTFSPVDGAGALHEHVSRDGRSAMATRRAPEQLGWAVPIYVAETDEIARREAKPHIENLFNKFLRMPQEMLLPPGYLSLASMQGVMQAKRALSTGRQTMEDMVEKGVFLCGSAATLREKLEQYQKEIGFGYLLPAIQFGTLPHELVRKSVELLSKEVIPHFRARAA